MYFIEKEQMNIHEMNSTFRIEMLGPQDNFRIRYWESSKSKGDRALTVEVALNGSEGSFFNKRDKFTVYLDSFTRWRFPNQDKLTIEEYQVVLKRVMKYLKMNDIITELE